MKISCKNNEFAIEVSKQEFLKIITSINNECHRPTEDMYDVDEVSQCFPDSLIITETMLDESPHGFIMWSDDFYELITEFVGYLVGDIPDFEKEFTILEDEG